MCIFLLSVVFQEETIEETIDNGQLEELIQDGKRELTLIDKYAEWKLWEAVEELSKGKAGDQKQG